MVAVLLAPLLPSQCQKAFERCSPCIVERYQSFAAAFPLDQQNPFIAGRSAHRQCEKLRYPQARGIKDLDQAIEPRRLQGLASLFCFCRFFRRCNQPVDLLHAHDLRQRPSELRSLDDRGRIVLGKALAEQEPVILLHGGKLSGSRRLRKLPFCEKGEEGPHVIGTCLSNATAPAAEESSI